MADMSGRDEVRKNGNERGDPNRATNRATLWAIVGTGVGLATLLLALASLFNARIDDVNSSLNARIDDLNSNLNARIDDVNANLNTRIDDLQEDIRELRALLIQALNESPPAN